MTTITCKGCLKALSDLERVSVDGKRYCRECATEMLREMAAAMSR